MGGSWSKNWDGSYICRRGKDAKDFRRRVFRSLATPIGSGNDIKNVTKISVPLLKRLSRPWNADSDSDSDFPPLTIFVKEEPEVTVDIMDVLSECPGIEIDGPRTATPLRESYRIALPSLPSQPNDLSSLYIPKAKLVTLLKLLQQAQHNSTESLVASINDLPASDGQVGWDDFETVMPKFSVGQFESSFGESWATNVVSLATSCRRSRSHLSSRCRGSRQKVVQV